MTSPRQVFPIDLAILWAFQRSHNLGNAKILLPVHSISGIISAARPVQPEEARQPVRTKFSLQHFEGVTLELLIGHVFDRGHTPCSRIRFTGFRTLTRGEPTARAVLLMNPSSVVSRNSALSGFGCAQVQRIEGAVTNGFEFLGTFNDLAVQWDSVCRQRQERLNFVQSRKKP